MESPSRAELMDLAWQEHSREWMGYAYRLTRDVEDAEDAVQDAIVRVLRSPNPALSTSGRISRFMFPAIRSAIIDRIRRRQTRSRFLRELLVEGASYASSSLDGLLEDEFHVRLREAISALDPEHREAIRLYYREGPRLTFRNVAAIQGTSPSTAYARVQQALELLREALVESQADNGLEGAEGWPPFVEE